MKNMEGSDKPFSALITDDDIAKYLQNNPDFFDKKPALLRAIRLPHAERGAVSLVEAQLDKLRQKIASLEDEITALMTRANQNDALFNAFASTYLALLAATKLCDVQKALDELAKSLRLTVCLSLYSDIHLYNEELNANALILDAAKIEAFKVRHLMGKEVYLGRLSKKDGALFMPSPPELGSYAILPISSGEDYQKAHKLKCNQTFEQPKKQEMGFLVFASQDGGHFQPAMDTLFITQLSAQIRVLLQKWQP